MLSQPVYSNFPSLLRRPVKGSIANLGSEVLLVFRNIRVGLSTLSLLNAVNVRAADILQDAKVENDIYGAFFRFLKIKFVDFQKVFMRMLTQHVLTNNPHSQHVKVCH